LLLLGTTSAFAQLKADRPLEEFSGIKSNSMLDITLIQGEANSLNLEAAVQEDLDAVKTEIHDGVLEIISSKNAGIKVNITVKSMKSIVVNGTGDVHVKNRLKTEVLTVKSNGSGDIFLDAEAKTINAELNGTGDIYLSGTTDQLVASVNGEGDIEASKLTSNKAAVSIAGTGDALVNAKQNLDAKVTGTGDILYTEEPAEKKIELDGTGDVRKAHPDETILTYGSDTTKISVGRKRVLITDEDKRDFHHNHHPGVPSFHHWTGVDVGFNSLFTSAGNSTMRKGSEYMQLDYGKSFSFAINFFEKDFHLYHDYINLVTGLGFEFDHFALQKNVSLRTDSSYTTATNSSPINYRKNNLNESLLTLPLMFDFNTSGNANRSVHIAVGVLGGLKIGSRTRQKYIDFNGETVKLTKSNDYNLDPFRYSLSARIGYGAFTVYANYSLSEFFKSGRGPQLYPVTAGINIHI
jgi:hypothetical protein